MLVTDHLFTLHISIQTTLYRKASGTTDTANMLSVKLLCWVSVFTTVLQGKTFFLVLSSNCFNVTHLNMQSIHKIEQEYLENLLRSYP